MLVTLPYKAVTPSAFGPDKCVCVSTSFAQSRFDGRNAARDDCQLVGDRCHSHIASATNEQSTATEDVAKNMEHISTLINGNGDSILRVRQSVGELLETSAELQELVGHFDTAKTA